MRKLIESACRENGRQRESYSLGMADAADSERLGAASPLNREPVGASVEQAPHAATVLLIEDEPGIVDFVRRGLEAEGFSVEAALDGIEGERLALRGGFDAIVLDLMLPGRSGLEILASVRRVDAERAGDRADRARARSRIAWRGSKPARWTISSSRSRWPSSWRACAPSCA